MTSGITCAALGCPNQDDGRLQSKGITFHRFPHALRETDRLRKWLLNVKRNKTIPLSMSYLCSEHFTEDCFDTDGLVVILKSDSVPTNFTSTDLQQSGAKNKIQAARSEYYTRSKKHEADGNQDLSTGTAKTTASVPKEDFHNRRRLKAKKGKKKDRQQGKQEAQLFKLVPVSTVDVETRSAVEAEYLKESGKQGRNKGTGSHIPVPIMIMDPAMRSATGKGNKKDEKEEGNKEAESLRRVPVLITDPAMRASLEARHKKSSKQGGNQPVVTFWPVSAPFVSDFQQNTSADSNFRPISAHELDHPYTTRVSLQEKLLETTRKLEVCKKQLNQERKRADRLKKQLNRHNRGFYSSIHNETVIIKKAKHTMKKKREMVKKEIEPPPPSETEMLEESLCDLPVIDLPEETTSLLSQLFQVSSGDSLMSELENFE